MLDIQVARQPIFNRQMRVMGYELYYAPVVDQTRAFPVDPDLAMSELLVRAFIDLGLADLVGGNLAFIGLTRAFLLQKVQLPLAPERVVLQVPVEILANPAAQNALVNLTGQGYILAATGVHDPSQIPNETKSLFQLVKLNMPQLDNESLVRTAFALRKNRMEMIGEGVNTQLELQRAIGMGLEYVQGGFLSKPNLVKGKALTHNRLTLMRLMHRIHDPKVEFAELERIVGQDVGLSYKLLQMINSAYYALPTRVESLRQALTMIGLKNLRSWMTMLLLSSLDDKPPELLQTAMVRGKMCENLAEKLRDPRKESFFLVGLFSALDALMDLPLDKALESLPLSDDIVSALLRYEGKFGEIMACVLAYENARWDLVAYPGLRVLDFRDAYFGAVRWMLEIRKVVGA